MKKLILAVFLFLAVTATQAQNPIDYISITNFNLGTVHEKPLHISVDSLHTRFNDWGSYYDSTRQTYRYMFQFSTHKIVVGEQVFVEQHPFDSTLMRFDYDQVIGTPDVWNKGRTSSRYYIEIDATGRASHRWYGSDQSVTPIYLKFNKLYN